MTAYTVDMLPGRIAAKIAVNPESGCWEWQGRRDKNGYGQVKWERRVRRIHRLVFEMLAGNLAAGLTLDHVAERGCSSRACCWPAHLEPVTAEENVRRGRIHSLPPWNPSAWSPKCPGCRAEVTRPGQYCDSCRCVSSNAKGRRCGNAVTADGRCEHHAAQVS